MHGAGSAFDSPSLSVGLALAVGMLAQALARHLRLPGIVLLLAAGVVLGPDLLDVVRPATLGGGLQALVGFAVAVILFEGGMNLNIRRLRREARSIRQLVSLGALVTLVGGAVAARLILGWSWSLSALFGSLVIVTGPSRPSRQGYIILGANDLARVMAHGLAAGGQEVVLVDSNPDACRAAQSEGLRVLHGSGLNESVLLRAGLDGRAGALAVTPNDEANLLFARTARQGFRIESVWVGLRRGHLSVSEEMVHKIGARLLFGRRRHTDLWTLRLERGLATREIWRLNQAGAEEEEASRLEEELSLLPLLVRRAGVVRPMDDRFKLRPGDELELLVFEEKRAGALEWLRQQSWEPVKGLPAQ